MTNTEVPEGVSERTMRIVQGLMNQAMDNNISDEERNAFLAKADEIMAKYRLDRAMFLDSNQAGTKLDGREIIVLDIPPIEFHTYIHYVSTLRSAIFRHCGCKIKSTAFQAKAVGYEADLDFANMLWTTVHMDFIRKLFPTWQRSLTFDENVYTLKNAGYSWPQVREMGLAVNARDYNGPLTAENAGSKLRTAYKRWAKKLGVVVPPGKHHSITPEKFRTSFASSYVSTVQIRLQDMKDKTDKQSQEAAGEAGALALIDDEERIAAAWYEIYPEDHPDEQRRRMEQWEKEEAEREANMTEEEKRKRDKENARWANRKVRVRNYYDQKGWAAGHSAGSKVRLSGGDEVQGSNGKALS